METTADGRAAELPETPEWIELTPPEVEPVRPRRTRLAAVAIASFTALTCLGLAATAVGQRTLDRRFDPRADIAVPSSGPAAASVVDDPAVVASAMTSWTAAGQSTVHVAGAAGGGVEWIEVRLVVDGRDVGPGVTRHVGRAASDVGDRAPGDGLTLWSADLAIPRGAHRPPADAVAVVEVRWTGRDGSGGPTLVLVPLGDGRRS